MKKGITICSLGFLLMGCASAQINEIDQKLDKQSDKEIVLVKVLNDSRCPEGVQCIWAGEVTIEVAAYENNKIVEQTQFVVNYNNAEEIKAWFSTHLPARKEKLKGISVVPYPKDGVIIQPQDYKIILD
nr:hypothetical protein [uncultured Flavobacterium sp.]